MKTHAPELRIFQCISISVTITRTAQSLCTGVSYKQKIGLHAHISIKVLQAIPKETFLVQVVLEMQTIFEHHVCFYGKVMYGFMG